MTGEVVHLRVGSEQTGGEIGCSDLRRSKSSTSEGSMLS